MRRSGLLPATLFLALVGITIVAYWPGLSGAFLFDDFPNLKELGSYGGVTDLDKLRIYLFSGFAGPTGRPLSLLSFLINDYTWPSDPWGFKYTNLLIHVLNGVMLFWLTYRIVQAQLPAERQAEPAWIAMLSASLWLLHPMQVSTTLYVVQRMAQLETLFVLAGLLGYVCWRVRLGTAPRAALLGMTLSIALGTIAAVFSKENGALLPALALTIELTVFAGRDHSFQLQVWRGVVLWLPSLAVAGYLLRSALRTWGSPISGRNFTLGERLLTESRVLLEYLHRLLLPSSKSRGLFSDSFPISTSLTHPPETFIAVAAIGGLILAALALRRRWPLFSLAILLFFVGHVMESTVIPLELYFEHRSYLPSVFLFLPVASLGVWAYQRVPQVVPWAFAALFGLVVAATWQRADLWGKPDELFLTWADENPTSARAQLAATHALVDRGQVGLAIRRLEASEARIPDSLSVRMQRLFLLESTGRPSRDGFKDLVHAARRLPFENEVLPALRELTDQAVSGETSGVSTAEMHTLLDALQANPNYGNNRFAERLIPYLEGRLYLAEKRPAAAAGSFDLALKRQNSVEAGLMEVALLASHQYFSEALRHLSEARQVLNHQADQTLKRPRTEYQAEIARLERAIKGDQEAAQGRQSRS